MTWLKEISKELRQAVEPAKVSKKLKPQEDSFLISIARELKQITHSMGKMPKLKKTTIEKKSVSEFNELTNFFKIWLAERQAELKKWDEIRVWRSEPNHAPSWFLTQVDVVKSLVESFDQKIEIPKPEIFRHFWFEEIIDQIWDPLLAPDSYVKSKKPEVFRSEWLTETCKDLKVTLNKSSKEDKVQKPAMQPFRSRWLEKSVNELRPLLRKLERETQMPILEPKEEICYYDLPGWLRVKIEGLRYLLTKIQKSKIQNNQPKKSFDNNSTSNWFSEYARDLKRFLPQKVSLVKSKEISFERKCPLVPTEFSVNSDGERGDFEVSKLTLDRERYKEFINRISHPETTRKIKSRDKKRASKRGQMTVVGVATRKVDHKNNKGYREVYFEIENPRCQGLIDLKKTRVAKFKKFDPALGRVVVVASEKASGHDAWKAQQESYLTSVDPRYSGGYGASTAKIPKSEKAEKCIPVLASDGRATKYISFGEYILLEGKSINGVSAELRRKYEIY